jgi:hypothetical protein
MVKEMDTNTKKELFLYLLDEYEDVLMWDHMQKMRKDAEFISESEFFSN